jgi:hypothetical protein
VANVQCTVRKILEELKEEDAAWHHVEESMCIGTRKCIKGLNEDLRRWKKKYDEV